MYSLKTLKFNGTLNFIVSAIFTVILVTSGMNSWFAVLLGAAMAVGMELPKVGFMYEAAVNKELNGWVRLILGFLSLVLVGFSIVASASYMINQTNVKTNDAIVQSTEYKQSVEDNKRQEMLFNAKLKEIENTTQTYDATINQTKNTLEKSNAAWERNTHTKTLNETTAQKTKRLAELNAELGAIKINPVDVSTIKLNSEEGYNGIIGSATNYINSKRETPITPDVVTMVFFISMYITYEILTVMLVVLYAFKMKKQKSVEVSSTPTITKTDNKVVEMKPQERERIIGFKNESINVNKDNLKKYLKYMYENEKNGCSAGYSTIAKEIEIGTEEARGIKSYLQQQGVLKVDGNRTKILKDKSAINL